MNTKNEMPASELKALKKKIAIRFAILPLFIGLTVLLPAGTFNFWQVYIYFAVLLVPVIFVILYFLKKDPQFLERRSKMKEQETQQKKIVFFASIVYFSGFILPGLDHRFGWSDIPTVVVIIADILILLSYIFIFYVFKENTYASRVIEVDQNQKLITTGPYSIVRHPMYLGVLVMFLSTPLALGSYWAIIPFAMLPVALVLRILNEEKVLSEQLPGYKEYCNKVRFRMIPFMW